MNDGPGRQERGYGGGPAVRPPGVSRALLRWLLPREDRDGAVDALDEKYREYAASPMGPLRARRWYRRQALGTLHPTVWKRRELPRRRGDTLVTSWMQDVRFGLRMLAKTPGMTAIILLTLAVGIGFNGSVFSLLNTIVLNEIPIERSDDLLFAIGTNFEQGMEELRISYPDYQVFASANRSFESFAAWATVGVNLSDGDSAPERFSGSRVTPSMFDVLRVRPLLGRRFEPSDAEPAAESVALLGYGVWRTRYGADPEVLGRPIRLDGVPTTVIGVLPPELEHTPFHPDIWTPLVRTPERETNRRQRFYLVVGRLAEGVSRETADTELKQLAAGIEAEYPETNEGVGAGLQTYSEGFSETPNVVIAWIMMGAVSFLLLIACANVANLLISRSVTRSREVLIRTAMGASRWRVVRQLLVESLMLSIAGGVGASAVAFWGARALDAAISHAGPPPWWDFSVRPSVFAFIAVLSVATSVVFGLAPALHATRGSVHEGLKDGGRSSGGAGTRRLTGALVVVQLALALVLLAGAGVMIRSTINILAIDFALAPEDLLTVRIGLDRDSYASNDAVIAFHDDLDGRLRALPGIEAVALASTFPPDNGFTVLAEVDGLERSAGNPPRSVQQMIVSPSYFDIAEVAPLRGRLFERADGLGDDPAIVVEQRLATSFWPRESAIGKRLRWVDETDTRWMTVVGVIPDIVQTLPMEFTDDFPIVYTPYRQEPIRSMGLLVKSAVDQETLTAMLRREVQRADPNLPLHSIAPLEQLISERTIGWRIISVLFLLLGAIALFLSCLGIYSVMAFAVGCRQQEIGIRMALGAARGGVLRLIARGAVRQTVLGLALGLVTAFGAMRVLELFMYEVSPTDPLTFAVTLLLLVATAAAATVVPARRASRVDPLVALRNE